MKPSFGNSHRLVSCLAALAMTGCAVLHHVQVGDVDNTAPANGHIDIKVSEMGINLEHVKTLARVTQGRNSGVEQGVRILEWFQMGPRTGAPVYNENYAENVLDAILTQCPSGRVTGLTSIRESAQYPVVSGEIVKISGWCLQ